VVKGGSSEPILEAVIRAADPAGVVTQIADSYWVSTP
jgi:hypothetical protein